MKKHFSILIFLSLFILAKGQVPEIIRLNSPLNINGHQDIVASQYIHMQPGFQFSANLDRSVHMHIGNNNPNPGTDPNPGEVPDEVSLTFYASIVDDHYRVHPPIHYPYKGVRIGEYYWSDVFYHPMPVFWGWTHMLVGDDSLSPVNQQWFDDYMPKIGMDNYTYSPNVNDFDKYYGRYYSRFTSKYMDERGVMYERQVSESELDRTLSLEETALEQSLSGWRKPDNKDYRQLFAMCPFIVGDDGTTHTNLTEVDVRLSLSAKNSDNPLAYNMGENPYRVYWFDRNSNMYNFNMMPGGARWHADTQWANGLQKLNENGEPVTVIHDGPKGSFAYLFYTVYYSTTESQIVIHDFVDTAKEGDDPANIYTGTPSWAWMNERWRRRLTDQELGYKLFIKVNNINRQEREWTKLVEGDEIPLLRAVKQYKYDYSDFDIVKINDPKSVAPSGYTELPNGYIRGFYVQYFIQNPESGKTVSDVILYASSVEDNAIGRRGYVQLKEARSGTGIGNNLMERSIRIYPNPVVSQLKIESIHPIQVTSLYDTSGRLIHRWNNPQNSIDMSNIPAGLYVIKVISGENIHTEKLYKK